MEDFPVQEGIFIFSYPIWVCVQPGPPVAFMTTQIEGAGEGFFVFTDKPAAEDYLVASGSGAQLKIAMVPNQAKFADMLEILASQGITHLVFDDRAAGTGYKRAIVLTEMLDEIRSNPQ